MPAGLLSIKLRCASWQQLATIYKRDLSRGSMFLRASAPPPIGTAVRIDLALPSASVIVLTGTVAQHRTDPQRGSGVELELAPIPSQTIWLIESALEAESKRRQTPATGVATGGAPGGGATGELPAIGQGEDLVAAEDELIKALLAEAESLKKLNPFLVLGVGYEASDADVRAAFGELTKRYHPDRFARYESAELRQVAAEIFILIRDAYRKLSAETGRAQALAALGRAPAPRAVPLRAPTPPPVAVPPPRPAARQPTASIPPAPSRIPETIAIPKLRVPEPNDTSSAASNAGSSETPTARPSQPLPIPPEAQRTQPPRASTPGRSGALPTVPIPSPPSSSQGIPRVPPRTPSQGIPRVAPRTPSQGVPRVGSDPAPRASTSQPLPRTSSSQPLPRLDAPSTDHRPVLATPPPVLTEASDGNPIDQLLEQGKFDEAILAAKVMAKKFPSDRTYRAAVEVCEGLRYLALRDRLEAAQRFESALEIDPSNERAARELADMRRQATNERKGLLTRLMGKKE